MTQKMVKKQPRPKPIASAPPPNRYKMGKKVKHEWYPHSVLNTIRFESGIKERRSPIYRSILTKVTNSLDSRLSFPVGLTRWVSRIALTNQEKKKIIEAMEKEYKSGWLDKARYDQAKAYLRRGGMHISESKLVGAIKREVVKPRLPKIISKSPRITPKTPKLRR